MGDRAGEYFEEAGERQPVRLNQLSGAFLEFGQRMGKVGSGVGTNDAVSCCNYGAGRGGRTPTRLPSADFESTRTPNSPAPNLIVTATYETAPLGSVKFGEGR